MRKFLSFITILIAIQLYAGVLSNYSHNTTEQENGTKNVNIKYSQRYIYPSRTDTRPGSIKEIHRYNKHYKNVTISELVDTLESIIISELPYSSFIKFNKAIIDSLQIGEYELVYMSIDMNTTYSKETDSVYIENTSQSWRNLRNGLNCFYNMNEDCIETIKFHGWGYTFGPLGKGFEEQVRPRKEKDRIDANFRICIRRDSVISIEGVFFY